jgi:MFS family permease
MTRQSTLWHNGDFIKFWSSETVSQLGNQVTLLALPLTAVLTLDASAGQMGLLNAASYLPFLVLTLFVGVWADRSRRRPLLIASALCRATILFCIPILAALDRLNIGLLLLGALLLGVFTVLFEVTYQAYVPSLVDRDHLVEANSKLQVSASATQMGGPALGGALVQWLTAPVALLVDAFSFLFSAAGMLAIRRTEPTPEREEQDNRVWTAIMTGLRFNFRDRSLRACVLEAGTYNLFWLVLQTVFLLYATHQLHLSPGAIGLALGCGAVGSLVGSLVAKRIADVYGIGTTITGSAVLGCAAPVLVPLASGPRPLVLATLVVSFFIGGAGETVTNIHVVSLRQSLTPSTMLGRMNAGYRFVAWGTVPIGALIGGALGELIGLRLTLFVAVAGLLLASLWLVASPIRAMHGLPTEADIAPAAERGEVPTEDSDLARPKLPGPV